MLMKHDFAEFCKDFFKPLQFIFVPDSLKEQAVLSSALRETLLSVLCNTERK